MRVGVNVNVVASSKYATAWKLAPLNTCECARRRNYSQVDRISLGMLGEVPTGYIDDGALSPAVLTLLKGDRFARIADLLIGCGGRGA